MKVDSRRIKEKSTFDTILSKIQKYSYLETFVLVVFYLVIGYLIDSKDVCILNGQVSYILILLSIITLFHGFENGLLALGLIGIAMWIFYPTFEYIEFLVALMMTLIFSEFHYYWTKRINEAELKSNYSSTKLNELSRAFYSLKISHDQLEKNYVVKPMSIRSSIEEILLSKRRVDEDISISDKNGEYYKNFLFLLEKSFNVNSGFIVYKNSDFNEEKLSKENVLISRTGGPTEYSMDEIFDNYLVNKSIDNKQPIYISDSKGEPTTSDLEESKFIAVIPSLENHEIVSLLIIEKMPFMSFNRENLTSISVLLEYLSLCIFEKNTLYAYHDLDVIKDNKFKFEYIRMKHLSGSYNVESTVLVLRIASELQSVRVYEKVEKMLRSLDMVTIVNENNLYYIVLMFPLNDESAALGYVNRLLNSLKEEKDKQFDYMAFNMKQTRLLNKYLEEDYNG